MPVDLPKSLNLKAQWKVYAIGGGLLAIGYYAYAKNQANAANAAGSANTGAVTNAGPGVGETIIQPTQVGPAGPPGKPGPAGPPGKPPPAPVPAGPPKAVPPSINAASFPKFISAIVPSSNHVVVFGSITKGGGHVGNVRGGAPVYALVNTAFGPVWEQGADFSKLPPGTKLATLQQFSSNIVK